jgi:hypothetical protein
MTSKVMAVALCLAAAPGSAQGDLKTKTAPVRLSLQIVSDKPGERCARSDASDPAPLVTVSLHWTFHDDFDEHPLLNGSRTTRAPARCRNRSMQAEKARSSGEKPNTTANSRSMWIPVTKGEGWSRSVSTRSRFEMACCRLSRAGYLPISRRCCSA